MRLIDFVNTAAVIPELEGTDRNAVIRELVQSLAEHGAVDQGRADGIAQAVILRENQGSTGFGKGVAVPHVKHEAVSKTVATVGRSSHGVDFQALDRAPVYTVVLLLSPKSDPDAHLAAMEKIFRHLREDNFRRFLRQADTREKIAELITEADESSAD
ncbi:MAG: PTS sugar transporter subunit IIA [Planctomycetota bacterium]|jgi:mannitol/fructose-specific phosphotransferase system IIA component (Ntr-type)